MANLYHVAFSYSYFSMKFGVKIAVILTPFGLSQSISCLVAPVVFGIWLLSINHDALYTIGNSVTCGCSSIGSCNTNALSSSVSFLASLMTCWLLVGAWTSWTALFLAIAINIIIPTQNNMIQNNGSLWGGVFVGCHHWTVCFFMWLFTIWNKRVLWINLPLWYLVCLYDISPPSLFWRWKSEIIVNKTDDQSSVSFFHGDLCNDISNLIL